MSDSGAQPETPRGRKELPPRVETISSEYTYLGKWGPVVAWTILWSVIGGLGVAMSLRPDGRSAFGPVVVAAVMLPLGYFGFRAVFWYVADEVLDFGTHLRIRLGSAWEQIELSRIERVRYYGGRTTRVFLTLRSPCAFGKVIRFVPRRNMSLSGLFSSRDVADDLEERVAEAHRKRLAAFQEQSRHGPSGGTGETGP
jgi:hypothetical protein